MRSSSSGVFFSTLCRPVSCASGSLVSGQSSAPEETGAVPRAARRPACQPKSGEGYRCYRPGWSDRGKGTQAMPGLPDRSHDSHHDRPTGAPGCTDTAAGFVRRSQSPEAYSPPPAFVEACADLRPQALLRAESITPDSTNPNHQSHGRTIRGLSGIPGLRIHPATETRTPFNPHRAAAQFNAFYPQCSGSGFRPNPEDYRAGALRIESLTLSYDSQNGLVPPAHGSNPPTQSPATNPWLPRAAPAAPAPASPSHPPARTPCSAFSWLPSPTGGRPSSPADSTPQPRSKPRPEWAHRSHPAWWGPPSAPPRLLPPGSCRGYSLRAAARSTRKTPSESHRDAARLPSET